MAKNLEHLEELASWLEAGAPHVAFYMHAGLGIVSDVIEYGGNVPEVEINKPGVGKCGTVCCIGGAAYQMATGTMGEKPKIEQYSGEYNWEDVRYEALKWLGLKDSGMHHFGHDLFSCDLAPEGCTPQQAAAAVRRIMVGKRPWTKTA